MGMTRTLLHVFVPALAGIMLFPVGAAAWNDPSSGEGRGGLGEVVVAKEPSWRVGQIFIIGNEVTRQDVILEQVGLWPGQRITLARIAHRA